MARFKKGQKIWMAVGKDQVEERIVKSCGNQRLTFENYSRSYYPNSEAFQPTKEEAIEAGKLFLLN